MVDAVKDYAAETAGAVGERVGTYAQSARETVEDAASLVVESLPKVLKARVTPQSGSRQSGQRYAIR